MVFRVFKSIIFTCFICVLFFQKGAVAAEKEAEGEKSNKPKRKRKVSLATSAVRMRDKNTFLFNNIEDN